MYFVPRPDREEEILCGRLVRTRVVTRLLAVSQTFAVIAHGCVREARAACHLGHRQALAEQSGDPWARRGHERMFAPGEDESLGRAPVPRSGRGYAELAVRDGVIGNTR